MTITEDVSLGELLDLIMDHGIFLELSSRLKLLTRPLSGTQQRLSIDWTQTRF